MQSTISFLNCFIFDNSNFSIKFNFQLKFVYFAQVPKHHHYEWLVAMCREGEEVTFSLFNVSKSVEKFGQMKILTEKQMSYRFLFCFS